MKIKLFDENFVGDLGISPFIDSGVNWDRNTEDYDVAIYTDRLARVLPLNENKINYAWIVEPPIINGENYGHLVPIANKFKKVFSYINSYSSRINNFEFIPIGGTWLKPEDINLYTNKNKLCSFIFSDKQWNGYHRMRHRLYDLIKNNTNIDFYGSGCGQKLPRDQKVLAFKDYKFTIVIENSEEDNYFTEKVIDPLLCGTVPIYIGSPKIGDIFNMDGIIKVRDVDDIITKLNSFNDDLYYSMLPAINDNFLRAKNYMHPELLIQKHILANINK